MKSAYKQSEIFLSQKDFSKKKWLLSVILYYFSITTCNFIFLELLFQTQLFRGKKQIKESHIGGSPLFDLAPPTGLEPVTP